MTAGTETRVEGASGRTPDWYWRWGIPLIAGLAALVAVSLAVGRLWDNVVVPSPFRADQEWKLAVRAAYFSAWLLACWLVARPGRGGGSSLLSGVDPLAGAGAQGGKHTEALLATIVIATGVAWAAYFLDVPMGTDEVLTNIFLVPQPFHVAASTYDNPNNHVLHTLLVWVAHRIGGWHPVALRMPAFLAYVLFLSILWRFVRTEYGPTVAAFATALIVTMPYMAAAATNGRGYTLLLLLFTSALLCGQALVRTPDSKALWAAWAAAVGLGFFTMPLMAFCAATTACWMLLARWRRCGREAFGRFAARTATWSLAALVLTAVLYAPIIATEGIGGVQEALVVKGSATPRALEFVWRPAVAWFRWHLGAPAWLQGALLATVVVGAAVPGRTCGRAWTLLSAMVVSTVALLMARPFLPMPRMLIWAMLVLMILAGAGATLVLERLAVRAQAIWPSVAVLAPRIVLRSSVAALLLAVSAWWATDPGLLPKYRDGRGPPLLSAVRSVAGHMRPGDYFATIDWAALGAIASMRRIRPVEHDAGWFHPQRDPQYRWSVHLLSAPERGTEAEGRGLLPGRLFLMSDKEDLGVQLDAAMRAHWPDHELVSTGGGGRVYMLDDWTMHPR